MCINNRRKESRVHKKFLPLIILYCALAFCPKAAFAGASLTITAGSTWSISGVKKASASTMSSYIRMQNNASGGNEDVNISVAVTSPGGSLWTASPDATPGANEFQLTADLTSPTKITSSPTLLVSGLTNNAFQDVFLTLITPPSGEQGSHTLTVTLTATNWRWACGGTFVKTHSSTGADLGVAPVDKTVTYGTVEVAPAGKCWITQNLGADNQASASNGGSTEALREQSGGWYWQYGKKQGYKHTGDTGTTVVTPGNADLSGTVPQAYMNNNTTGSWGTAQDPCRLLLGATTYSGTYWRIPNQLDWDTFGATIAGDASAFRSPLVLHFSGRICDETCSPAYKLQGRASSGNMSWGSSTNSMSTDSIVFIVGAGSNNTNALDKNFAPPLRCILDALE